MLNFYTFNIKYIFRHEVIVTHVFEMVWKLKKLWRYLSHRRHQGVSFDLKVVYCRPVLQPFCLFEAWLLHQVHTFVLYSI